MKQQDHAEHIFIPVRNSLPVGDETTNRLPQGTGPVGTRALVEGRHPCSEKSAQEVSRIILGSGWGIRRLSVHRSRRHRGDEERTGADPRGRCPGREVAREGN